MWIFFYIIPGIFLCCLKLVSASKMALVQDVNDCECSASFKVKLGKNMYTFGVENTTAEYAQLLISLRPLVLENENEILGQFQSGEQACYKLGKYIFLIFTNNLKYQFNTNCLLYFFQGKCDVHLEISRHHKYTVIVSFSRSQQQRRMSIEMELKKVAINDDDVAVLPKVEVKPSSAKVVAESKPPNPAKVPPVGKPTSPAEAEDENGVSAGKKNKKKTKKKDKANKKAESKEPTASPEAPSKARVTRLHTQFISRKSLLTWSDFLKTSDSVQQEIADTIKLCIKKTDDLEKQSVKKNRFRSFSMTMTCRSEESTLNI